MVRAARDLAVITVALGAAACLSRPPHFPDGRNFVVHAALGASTIDLEVAPVSAATPSRPFIFFTTGDGGWRSGDRDLFACLAAARYPLAGLSAPDYLKHLRFEPTTRDQLIIDYGTLIDSARRALAIPDDQPMILAGFSRGAGLSVVAASQANRSGSVLGVVAMALGDAEEFVRHGDNARTMAALRPFELLRDPFPVPVAVLVSTRDKYLPAERAQTLFGADGGRRRFHAIESTSHTFAGARPRLCEQVLADIEWIQGLPATAVRWSP